MRKCDEHQTLVHLDVHVCPVFVCVCVWGGGGGVLSFIHIQCIHENPKNIEMKSFCTPKNGLSLHMSHDVVSNNVAFWQVWTLTSLYIQPSFKLRNSNYVRSVA